MDELTTWEDAFFASGDPQTLLERFGSPLYVYSERLLRQRSADMRDLVTDPPLEVHYSVKANANPALLRIIREEGLLADAMSPGELALLQQAGYPPQDLFYVPNNVSDAELMLAHQAGVLISFDSLDQLERMGQLAPGSPVALRLNPGIGAGHHAKVITAGENTKFGLMPDQLDQARALAAKYDLSLVGLNQHIGSLFMEPEPYLAAADRFFDLALTIPGLSFVDLGGGFGIPHRKLAGEKRLDLAELGRGLAERIHRFFVRYGRPIRVKTEPGRYVVAESGVLLGTVHAVKTLGGTTYAGSDLGFNVLARPMLYGSWHDLLVYRNHQRLETDQLQKQTVVGNICETGDVLAEERPLPPLKRGDVLVVLDAGAYGYAMASNYNNRLRPAEVLIGLDGKPRLIRRRETPQDLMRGLVEP